MTPDTEALNGGLMPVAMAERILAETVQSMRAGFSKVMIDALEAMSRKARSDVQDQVEAYETLIATVEHSAIAASALVEEASGLSESERDALLQLLRSFQNLAPRSILQAPAQPVFN
jgi:hypothetical protein